VITLITIIHVSACVFLILVVLLQTGKGAEMGAVFGGGGSSTIFGASGAGNFLTRLTTATAVIFFVTSLALAWSSLSRTRATVFDRPLPEPPPLNAPAEPKPRGDDQAGAQPPAAGEKPAESEPGSGGGAPEPQPVPAQ
jgi:preprotein translocase subunit SecG